MDSLLPTKIEPLLTLDPYLVQGKIPSPRSGLVPLVDTSKPGALEVPEDPGGRKDHGSWCLFFSEAGFQ